MSGFDWFLLGVAVGVSVFTLVLWLLDLWVGK